MATGSEPRQPGGDAPGADGDRVDMVDVIGGRAHGDIDGGLEVSWELDGPPAAVVVVVDLDPQHR